MKPFPVAKPRRKAQPAGKTPDGGAGTPGASKSGIQPLAGTIRALIKYNAWRRGAEIPQPDCKAVGRAIESAIAHLERMKREEAEDTEGTELKSCTKIHAKELLAGFSSDENWSKYAEALENLCRKLERERDEAREAAIKLLEKGCDRECAPLYYARRLERERDEARADLEFRRGLFKVQEEQLNKVRLELEEARKQVEDQKSRIGELFAALEKLTSERDEARDWRPVEIELPEDDATVLIHL